MVKVRLGTTWREDAAVRAALVRGGAPALEAEAAIVEALALEVDGVDVAGGLAEGALVAAVEGLASAALELLRGSGRAQVHFSEGGLELLLRRRGASALLTVVGLGRPARVLARDVEVELSELAVAVREATEGLAAELRALAPRGEAARALAALAAQLADAEPGIVAGTASPLPRRERRREVRGDAPACAFEIHDDDELIGSYRGPGADLGSLLAPGRVTLRLADGRDVFTVEGAPFLLLRDLAAFGRRVADAVRRGDRRASAELAQPRRRGSLQLELDLRDATLAIGDAPPTTCAPLPLARALLEAALDFCGAVAARNPWQAENGWLAELRRSAAEEVLHVQELLAGDVFAEAGVEARARRPAALPRAPLGPGRMKHLAFRRTLALEVGPPAGFGLALARERLVAAGEKAVVAVDAARGGVAWRREGVRFAALAGGTAWLADAGRLSAVDVATGRERWSRPLSGLPEGAPRAIARLSGGLTLATSAGEVTALEPEAGRTAWRFAPPAARDLAVAALGPLALVGSGSGFLYALEPSGALAWRVRLPGPLVAPPSPWGRLAVALCTTDRGGSLVAVDPTSGRRVFELPLDVTPTAAPLPFAGLLAIPAVVAGDPVVVAVDAAGRLAWEDAPPIGAGPVALGAAGALLLAKTARGTCVALGRDGDARWTHASEAAHPPAPNVAPVAARGVALVASEGVAALDLETGAVLATLAVTAPERLAADGDLRVWGMDAEGTVTGVRLETHLSVVAGARR
ncbi:MAG: PQQ-binding-like beta-propeller repeat protein [Anaeromyxobacteraceae bacterium]